MNSHYTVKLGMEQITSYHKAMVQGIGVGRRRSAKSIVRGAWIHCLKYRNQEAAELLKSVMDELEKERR